MNFHLPVAVNRYLISEHLEVKCYFGVAIVQSNKVNDQ